MKLLISVAPGWKSWFSLYLKNICLSWYLPWKVRSTYRRLSYSLKLWLDKVASFLFVFKGCLSPWLWKQLIAPPLGEQLNVLWKQSTSKSNSQKLPVIFHSLPHTLFLTHHFMRRIFKLNINTANSLYWRKLTIPPCLLQTHTPLGHYYFLPQNVINTTQLAGKFCWVIQHQQGLTSYIFCFGQLTNLLQGSPIWRQVFSCLFWSFFKSEN